MELSKDDVCVRAVSHCRSMVRHNTLAYAKQCLCQRLSTVRLSVSCAQVGEGEFGTVHRAKWYGTIVAVKILRRSDAVAVGDFRYLSSSSLSPATEALSARVSALCNHALLALTM